MVKYSSHFYSTLPGVPEFNKMFIYCKGDIVWFGELQYKARGHMVYGINPDISKNWEIYVRKVVSK